MPLFWLSLAFLLGLVAQDGLSWAPSMWLALAGIAAAVALFWAQRRRWRRWTPNWLDGAWGWLAARLSPLRGRFSGWRLPYYPLGYGWLLVAFSLGGWRGQLVRLPEGAGALRSYNDWPTPLVLEGVVVAPPDDRDRFTYLRVQVDQWRPREAPVFRAVAGLLLVQAPPGGDWRYGDRLRLQGWLKTPPNLGDFSFQEALLRQGIYSYFVCASPDETCLQRIGRDQGSGWLALLYNGREKSLNLIYRQLPDPEAALVAGILLGVDNRIPSSVQQAFRDTGISHIVAISGFNITLLSGLISAFFLRLLGRRRRFLAAGLSLLVIAAYTVLVGAFAAVVRAAILGGLAVFARQLGRRQHGLNSLTFAAALMAGFDPAVLADVGFQLSFTATLGLVLYGTSLEQAAVESLRSLTSPALARRLGGLVAEYGLLTLAAQAMTLPVIWVQFQRLSLIAPLANLLVLPVQPLLMIAAGTALLCGALLFPLGQAIAVLAWLAAAYTIRVAEALAQAPLAAITVERPALGWIVLCYGVLLAAPFLPGWLRSAASPGDQALSSPAGQSRAGDRIRAWAPGVILLGMAGLVLLVWQAVLLAPDGRLHLTLLDVGGGEALLIQTPQGRAVLINGGTNVSRLSNALGRRLPFLQREVDFLVVASVGEAQTQALPQLVERLQIGRVLWAGAPSGSYSARQLQKKLAEVGIPVLTAQTGQRLDLGSGASLRVLAVTGRGAVYLLEWGSFSALLPLGLNFEAQEALLKQPQPAGVTALLLAEGGLAALNTAEWLAHWQPRLLLLSVAAGDPEGRPEPELLAATSPYWLLRTDRNGWIHLSTDGRQLWVEVARP